ncbi:protein Shroom3 isoform X3 [Trematomus bernacchii]|uniref:protein Shroom3 isoform X3 n=1 Tax=Trematomus bernacchii TaxID=40690 RepID=UPI00146D930F|nr:protein Shroom3 isoform X3 [Trematomus bernacchii]
MENGVRAGLRQQAGGWVLLEARLQGGAPWGFTLQGGLEHGEPLIISKVEEGGKADSLDQPLLTGDEIVIINDVELTGFRQEAIALVKGSYKTLQLTVRRELDPGYIKEFGTSRPSLPALPPPSTLSPSPPSPPSPQTPPSSHHSTPCSSGGVQLRIKKRRSEPASRPHSWHSTKLGEGPQQVDRGGMDTMSSAWHHNYHASASTTDLSGGYDSGGSSLRKSPDQYSSRGSMDSLDPPQSTHLNPGAQNHHTNSGPHPAYSSCHQLSSARSSNSIDHLHSKRDSAYSSFSTSSSIPEYLASTPSFSPERSYSLETVLQRERRGGDMQQADVCYAQTVYDVQRGHEHQLSSTSAALLSNRESRGEGEARPGHSRELQGGVCYRGSSSGSSSSGSSSGGVPASQRHSVGPIWGPSASRSSYENLKGAPAPPMRSDSYAAIRNHERPNSWSSLDHARSLRSLQKGSWHHSSGPVASSAAKCSYGAEGQLHTVIEKSPESSPTIKPRLGGGFPSPPSCPGPTSGPAGPGPQLIVPTGIHPVPQHQPLNAKIPGPIQGPGSLGGYPAPTQQQQGIEGREEGTTEGREERRISATENGYQNNPSSLLYSYPSSSTAPFTQPRPRAQQADRPYQEESYSELYRPYMKTARDPSEEHTTRQGPHGQSFQGSQIQTSKRPHSLVFQEESQDFNIPHIQSAAGHRAPSSEEWRDPCIPVQSRGDRRRSMDQTSTLSEPVTSPRLAQGQVLPTHTPAPLSCPPPFPSYLSDWDHQEEDKDREHPLTRLEIALAEVQRGSSPNSVISAGSHGNSSVGDGSQGPVRSLSVLEKVSRFERRERTGKQRSHSTTTAQDKASHLRMTEKGRNSPCGPDDLRNMLERSNSRTKAHRTLSYRGGSSEHPKYRTPADPSSALQRSRSTFQLVESREVDSSKEFPCMQDILGPMGDTSFNRSYRDSLKDAQSKVLGSTSFRRRDLRSSISPTPPPTPPPTAPPPVSSSITDQTQHVSAKNHSLEKKGPKTMPKPQGVVMAPQLLPLVTSLHTPKERHVVNPETRGPSPPALPNVPPVGPPGLTRICGRKRLNLDQKKRSYSEPENMNEVGVSDAETAALFRRGGDTSVADRRRMFELEANRVGGGPLQNATSRPDLRQLQHDALADYMERKRSVKRDKGGQRSGLRPRSAYLQPETSNHTASYCQSDTRSLSPTSSLLSLQDSVADRSFSSCSALPPGEDLWSLQSNLFYPGRVTTPRPASHSSTGWRAIPVVQTKIQYLNNMDCYERLQTSSSSNASSDSLPELQHGFLQDGLLQDVPPEAGLRRQTSSSKDVQQSASEHPLHLGLSEQLNGALQRAGSARGSGRSASTEDLLERSEERQMTPQHCRSRSSPTAQRLHQDPAGDGRMLGVCYPEPGRPSLAEDRPAVVQLSDGLFSLRGSRTSLNSVQPAGPSQDPGSSHTPVTCRERQRLSERQRASSTSTLAASVGLPSPLSPPGALDSGSAEWHASERLSQANLDAITFPGTLSNTTLVTEGQTRHSFSDSRGLEDTAGDMCRERASSLDMIAGCSAENSKQVSPVMPTHLPHIQLASPPNRKDSRTTPSSPPPSYHPSIPQHLSSLRISESSLFSSSDQPQPVESTPGRPLDDFDEVFLQNPDPPSPHIKETSLLEDFPPPPPLKLEEEAGHQTVGSLTPQPSTFTTSTQPLDSLSLEYQHLPRREKTWDELRVEALARQLVLQDSSLAPLLDTWGGKSTVELMEETFPNSRLVGNSLWQGSGRLEDRIQDGVCDPAQSSAAAPGKETDLDEHEKDLNTKKLELCEALRGSLAALRQEKEALSEEQRGHQELGAGVETLLQGHLRPNERDKYSMFIGDLERMVNLLLSLCSRLSRIHRALLALEREEQTQEDKASERDCLHHKRSLLLAQTEDARELKDNLDRRQRVVHTIVSSYLTEPQLQDYQRFVSTKPCLLIRQRHLDELIRQGEEQLTRLAESLPQELAEARGWSRGCLFSSSSIAHWSSAYQPAVIPGPAHLVRSTTVTSL